MWNPESEFPGDKPPQYRRLESAAGHRDRRRVMGDCAAAIGQTLSAKFRERVHVEPEVLDSWFNGIQLPCLEEPPVLPDCPSVADDWERAAVELDCLASLGKTNWYAEGSYPPDLRVRPSHVIAKEDKVRVVRDWPAAAFSWNSVLVNPPAQYAAMGDF